jgi:hypothetical protein
MALETPSTALNLSIAASEGPMTLGNKMNKAEKSDCSFPNVLPGTDGRTRRRGPVFAFEKVPILQNWVAGVRVSPYIRLDFLAAHLKKGT